MSSSIWPILLGLIALVAGAVWFDAQHGAPGAAGDNANATDGMSNSAARLQTAAK